MLKRLYQRPVYALSLLVFLVFGAMLVSQARVSGDYAFHNGAAHTYIHDGRTLAPVPTFYYYRLVALVYSVLPVISVWGAGLQVNVFHYLAIALIIFLYLPITLHPQRRVWCGCMCGLP